MVQAEVFGGLLFAETPFGKDGFGTVKVDVGRGQDDDAPVIAAVVRMLGQDGDAGFEIAFSEYIVF
jgi:hypothetical protein